MSRSIMLLLAGFVSVFTLNSCATPETQKADAVTPTKVVLTDLGNGVCRQLPSGLMWQIKESQKSSTWEEADVYAIRLELGGVDNWRLPTREECLRLSELLEIKKGDCPLKSNELIGSATIISISRGIGKIIHSAVDLSFVG